MQTVRIIIKGKVQGVFFRKYTVDAALKYRITGFVQNAGNGDVIMEATGDENAIKEFVAWCHSGSPHAEVKQVEVTPLPYNQYEHFKIRY